MSDEPMNRWWSKRSSEGDDGDDDVADADADEVARRNERTRGDIVVVDDDDVAELRGEKPSENRRTKPTTKA